MQVRPDHKTMYDKNRSQRSEYLYEKERQAHQDVTPNKVNDLAQVKSLLYSPSALTPGLRSPSDNRRENSEIRDKLREY